MSSVVTIESKKGPQYKRVALIVGAGRGIGANFARRILKEDPDFGVAVVRRSDQLQLQSLEDELGKERCRGFLLDATNETEVNDLVALIELEMGPLELVLYNVGANMGNRELHQTSSKIFTLAWRLGCLGAFLVAKATVPVMAERGRGTFLITGATAGVRGGPTQMAHAAAMGGRRMLAQSLAAQFAPKGVHVCHVVVDGMVDSPDTIGKFFGRQYSKVREAMLAKGGIIVPAELARVYWHIHSQPSTVWTSELDVRPFSEKPWYQATVSHL